MNALMTGMMLTHFAWRHVAGAETAGHLSFWFVMSTAIMVGFAFAYPVNWWLVSHNMKHGMLTVRADSAASHSVHEPRGHGGEAGHGAGGPQPSAGAKALMTVLTSALLAAVLAFIRSHI